MVGTYNSWLVLLSILVAIFVSYTALSLSARVARAKNSTNTGMWVVGGALAMGCGIWSMHFIGMLAFSLPIPLTYDLGLTVASLVIAIAISGFALSVASNPEISIVQLSFSAAIMGAGISAMHYSGMAAIDLVPMITYEPLIMAASIVIAIVASFAALWLFFQLREGNSWGMRLARVAAAFVMGFAISGMHYTGHGRFALQRPLLLHRRSERQHRLTRGHHRRHRRRGAVDYDGLPRRRGPSRRRCA
jgi:diguanylate cyclase